MTAADPRRWRSARHYVLSELPTHRLVSSLGLAVDSLGFSRAGVSIVGEDGAHRVVAFCGPGGSDLDDAEARVCDSVLGSGQPDSSDPTCLGIPLRGRESWVIGTLWAHDPNPAPGRIDQLARIGVAVEDHLELARRAADAQVGSAISPAEVHRAIETDQIVPWYQPIIELSTGRTIGYEALARWEHDSGAIVGPVDFIPVAEDSELIVDLDLAVARRALADLARWHQVDPTLRMSINLSGHHFATMDTVAFLDQLTADTGVAPAMVDLEVTETMQLHDRFVVAAVASGLRELGFRIWLDDFGTGFGSLEHLLVMPLDGLKIDRSFAAVLDRVSGLDVARSMSLMATQLGLVVTIEGVETPVQAHVAGELGCDFAQGYLWSPPVSAASVSPGATYAPAISTAVAG